MHRIFLKKYQEYCKARNLREEIFKMTQKEEEILEDYLERFCIISNDPSKTN
jgi:hypothetical protein